MALQGNGGIHKISPFNFVSKMRRDRTPTVGSMYDDGWLNDLHCRVFEYALNHPATESLAAPLRASSSPDDQAIESVSVERVREFMRSSPSDQKRIR